MGDASHYTDTILQAIEIISQNNVQNANYDRTVQAEIKKCLDQATGKYKISYEGITQTAYASDPKNKYQKGQGVYVLIPSNNTQRVKTIINTIDHLVTTTDGQKQTSDLYNEMGPNALVPSLQNLVQLCSYKDQNINLLGSIFNLSNDYTKYLKNSNGLVIKGTLQTKLPIEQQAYGQYGIKVVCKFKKNGNQDQIISKEYTLSNLNVIGYPYTVTEPTQIYSLQEFDGQNFIGIESISAFCSGFPKKEQEKPSDIFISNIQIQGAGLLNISNNDGYTVFINYSANGDTINNDIPQILLKGELKLQGTIITDKVEYYWFKQNGTVFKGNDKYSSYGGDGWECLNNKDGKSFIGAKTNKFYFCGSETDKGKIPSAVLDSKFYNIKCVAVYNGVKKVEGKGKVYNQNITNSLAVLSSDGSSVDYYFGNGSPTLRCVELDENNNQTIVGDNFTWTIEYKDGTTEKIETAAGDLSAYLSAKEAYQSFQKEYKKVAKNDKKAYYTANEYKVDDWNSVKSLQIANGNLLQNVNINGIKDWAKITCGVEKNGAYIGTASITLYNHMEVKGQYSLNIINGTQVFQYDDDGISPYSSIKQSPLEIKPLQLALVDNEGRRISFKQIKGNGHIYWCFPKTNSLLVSNDPNFQNALNYNGMYGTVKTLAADDTYAIYENLQTFSYSIAQVFDYDKKENNIRLYIEYKDMVFDVYTDFTFPKSGDPGTNGTKYFAKIFPGFLNGNKNASTFTNKISDRVYIDNNGKGYNDYGQDINGFKGILYNGSVQMEQTPSFWSCPIETANSKGSVSDKIETENSSHFSFEKWGNILHLKGVNASTESRMDILRAQFGSGQENKYFAELPICYVHTSADGSGNSEYRVKVKQKTGYSYVVYAEDGTHPDYGKNNTFEIIVEKLESGYYIEQDPEKYSWTWNVEGNLEKKEQKLNIATILPKESFDGSDLTSKIRVKIGSKVRIHIPIYMLINRYGHKALNDWDGNSIELGEDNGTILAPQVGAGKKNDNNQFTGLLMGQVKYNPNATTSQVGLFGYDKGQRTIFLDAQTGKAQFGKNNAGKIIIDPRLKINADNKDDQEKYKDAGLLYSNEYTLPNPSSVTNGTSYTKLNVKTYRPSSSAGMIIDLSTPQIGFGNGNFYITKNGDLHSETGDIGGWQITSSSLRSTYDAGDGKTGGVYLSSNASTPTNKAIRVNDGNKNIFSVDYRGHLHSEAGDIAGWNISPESLSKNNVGMNSSTNTTNNDYKAGTKTKAFFANGDNFYVTHDGYLKSQSGKIASWNINSTALYADGDKVGLGEKTISNPFGSGNITANIWGYDSNDSLNFALSNQGRLFSKLGLIGGWHIDSDMLYTGNKYGAGNGIRLYKDGTIQGGKPSTYVDAQGNAATNSNPVYWTINNKGDASFNNIDASGGTIGNWKITNGALVGPASGSTKVALTEDGTIVAKQGKIGGCTIYNDGIGAANWKVSSDGKAYFTNLTSLSGSLGGGTITGGGSGSNLGGFSGCNIPVGSNYGEDGQTLKTIIENTAFEKINASTGTFKNLITDTIETNTFTINGQTVSWQDVTVVYDVRIVGTNTLKVYKTKLKLLTASSPLTPEDNNLPTGQQS